MSRTNGGTVKGILRRDRKCWLCKRGVREDEASRDHKSPRSLGGPTKARNYLLAHRQCNSARGNLPFHLTQAIVFEFRGKSTEVICQELRKASIEWLHAHGDR